MPGENGCPHCLSVRALSITISIFGGGNILITGLANLIWPSYGTAFLELAASIYPGYQATASLGSVIVGTLYGLLDGFVAGLIIWLGLQFVCSQECCGNRLRVITAKD